jgi:hypothetical protein
VKRELVPGVHRHLTVDMTGAIWRVSLPVAPPGPALAELDQVLTTSPDSLPHVLLLRFAQLASAAAVATDGRLNRVRERALSIASERAISTLAAFSPPIVAVVHGEANELACAILAFADLILASEESRFVQGERGRLGYRGYRHGVPGGVLSARQALRAGLINGAISQTQLDREVERLLAALTRQQAMALRQVKRAVILGLEGADPLALFSGHRSASSDPPPADGEQDTEAQRFGKQ